MSKNIHWAPVDLATGEVWSAWLTPTKALCLSELEKNGMDKLASFVVRQVQIVVLPQKRKK